MDRLNQLRAGGEASAGRDPLDSSSPSEAYMSANESSKYFSLSDSTFDITPIKDVSLASTAVDPDSSLTGPNEIISNLSSITKKDVMFDNFNIDKQTDVANMLSGSVDIFNDNDNSFDGHELVIDDAVEIDDKSNLDKECQDKADENVSQGALLDTPVDVASKDTEVVLQIDGKNVDAIDIGNGLYLYRKEGQEELAAVQIINDDDQQQPSFKFLKVRENAEGNLEVYEEFEIEVTKDVPANEVTTSDKTTPHLPIKNINKVITESSSSKVAETMDKTTLKEVSSTSKIEVETEVKETPADSKTEVNFNGKMMKFSESRKSPVVGSFTPMTYHSTPNKEGKPLTKTMVDLQLHPNRHSDNVKKTIEVHTDSQSKKLVSEECQKVKTESEAKKVIVDMITKKVSKQNEEVDKITTQNLQKQENDMRSVIDSVSDSTVTIADSKKAVYEKLNEPVISKTQPDNDNKQSVDETEVKVNATLPKVDPISQTKTDPLKQDIKMKEDNLTVSNIKNIKSDKVLIDDKDQAKQSVSSKPEEVIVSDAFVTKTNEACKNDTNDLGNIERSIKKSALEKSDNSFEFASTKDDGKNNSTNDLVESNKSATGEKDQVFHKPKEIGKNIVQVADTIIKSFPLPNQSKEVICQISSHSSQKSNEVSSSSSSLSQTSKPICIEDAPNNPKIPIIDAKETPSPIVTSNNPTLNVQQLYTSQNNSEVQLRTSEILNPKSSEPSTITKPLNPKLEFMAGNHPQAKVFDLKTVSKIVKLNPVLTSIEAKTQSLPQKSNVLEKKVELKPNAEKYSAAKITDLKLMPGQKHFVAAKSVPNVKINNPAQLAIEPKSILKTEMFIPAPKTVSAREKCNPFEKKVDTKEIAKVNNLCPVKKVIKPETVSKTEVNILAEKKIKPETIVKADNFSVANVIPKTKDEGNTVPKIVPSLEKKEVKIPGVSSNSEAKPTNNNHTAVPFGKWTDANRQEFLNKFKDVKVPASSNTKQIKNSNDLNRIDILKKIDSQRSNNASAKIHDKSNVKDSVFSTKAAPSKTESKIPVKNEGLKLKAKPTVVESNTAQQDSVTTATVCPIVTAAVSSSTVTTTPAYSDVSIEPTERIVNVTDLISKTIIGMLNKAPMPMTNVHNTLADSSLVDNNVTVTKPQEIQSTDTQGHKEDSSGSLDYIEMKMNELHGIPFVERPPHELPKVHKSYGKTKEVNPEKKLPKKQNIAPATSKQSLMQDNVIDIDSDEEIIKHEPITGDTDASKKLSFSTAPVKMNVSGKTIPKSTELLKKEAVITENEFDKFAGSNAIAYENCLTVKFDGRKTANVAQSVKEKEASKKLYSGNKMNQIETKNKLPQKPNISQNKYTNLVPNTTKSEKVTDDANSKPYQSKIASAYQSALNSKRQTDRPITIIEDKPVKVVFMDANPEFVTNKLNVQGKELSPAKQVDAPGDSSGVKLTPPRISEKTETIDDIKQQDDTKTKTKHQRKQVLNPVETPELELIQSGALEVSPKRKRKIDDNKTDKGHKNLVHKKQYLLGRGAVTDDNPQVNQSTKETVSCTEIVSERSAVSAIDSLVKAAELLENQTQMISDQSASPNSDSQQNSPVKRGRGRPRKYPLPEGAADIKVASPSPQKKPRLIDAKPIKRPDPVTDEDSTDGEEIIRENWTMGKINENIVCPICNKLFRSENVVFKHVKHCTGVSPSRSDSDKLSPHRMRLSRGSDSKSPDSKSDDMDVSEKSSDSTKITPKKRKSKESIAKDETENTEVTENTSVKNPDSKTAEENHEKAKKVSEDGPRTEETKTSTEEKPAKVTKVPKSHSVQQSSNLVCEFCEKTFRQLSYLLKHKLQHKKEQIKKLEAEKMLNKTQVFGCEVCKKEFRKLHHLVQHRIIHDPDVPARTTRKSSSEQTDNKPLKEQSAPKQNEDLSAGFRCEPCDKSFRKLHHLVEHRETHDGINRQKSNVQAVIEKPPPPPQCNVCKKTFRKLHHLVEHKEQHVEHKEQHVEQVETCSEKSDDKSVKSALSTKDIIHECSLCYMVFPNEHSLNKHFFNCQQKKKRQSKAKEKPENVDGSDKLEESAKSEESADEDNVALKIVAEEIIETATEEVSKNLTTQENVEMKTLVEKPTDVEMTSSESDKVEKMQISFKPVQEEVTHELTSTPAKRNLSKSNDSQETAPEKVKKINIDNQQDKAKPLPKKTPVKDKVVPSVTQRQKTNMASIPVALESKPESSDDDEVRYMLNPDLKVDENSQSKAFLKVRIHKRNSLQIERPKSHDLMKRRTSLQHPPKNLRTKGKAVPTTKRLLKLPEATATDSDDSDVKYSFPEPVPEKVVSKGTPNEKKTPRKSIAEKRKSLSGIAKRKSLGKGLTATLKANPPPIRIIKRRTLDVEHRCDCGQLFNSAALLTRHTSLAHTPPRIRRRRSPPPDDLPKPTRKSTVYTQATRKSSVASTSNVKPTRKPSVVATSNAKPTRKSSVASNTTAKPTRKSSAKSEITETRKTPEAGPAKSSTKPKRSMAHSGVPVPQKMRKLLMKNVK